MTIKNFGFLALPALLLSMSSCLSNDKEADYADWRTKNLEYIDSIQNLRQNGESLFQKISPDWDKTSFVLLKWHNDRALTASALSPLSNSTVDVKYILTNVEGDTIDSSYHQTQYGDSIYRTTPNTLITGFQIALLNMHVGDSVTAVIPYEAGYGATGSGNILPYSTLSFEIKLVGIPALETRPWWN